MTDHDHIAPHGLLSLPDHHLVRAARGGGVAPDHVEVRRTTLEEFHSERSADAATVVEQTSSIDALLHGAYEGDVTFAELARHGDLGIGTVQHLDGEMLALDGEFLQVRADGSVHVLDPDTATPFAVVCRFRPDAPRDLGAMSWAELVDELGAGVDDRLVQAVRIDAVLDHVALRSVPRQSRPYPPLAEVVAHQTTWDAHDVHGTIVGFRFPSTLQGIEVAGVHLHFVSHDRAVGGHVTDLTLRSGTLWLQELDELHVEVPRGVHVAAADEGADVGAAIRAVEGGSGSA